MLSKLGVGEFSLFGPVGRISRGMYVGRVVASGWADLIVVFSDGSNTAGSSASWSNGSIPVFENADWIVSALNAHSQATA